MSVDRREHTHLKERSILYGFPKSDTLLHRGATAISI